MIYPGHSSGRPAWSVLFLCILSIICFGQASHASPAEKVQDTGAKNATKVKYQRLKIFKPYHCLRRKQHVVDEENALRALVADCKDSDIKLPKIDFSKHTLIAMTAHTDGCQRPELKIIREDAEKRYRHIIIDDRPMRCRGIGYVPFLVLIRKLPPGYEVTFEHQTEPGRDNKR